ncbi:MAG: type II secretion system protein GspN [Proteobacteria bacterium]|nr:type II secretion system protein GspN [Pseudomonadota bacterium]
MKNKKLIFFYIFWGALSTLFFTYWLFPSALLEQVMTSSIRNYSKDLKVQFKDIKPALPPGLKLSDVNVSYFDVPVFNAEYIKLMPGISSLMSDTKRLTIDAVSCGGDWDTAIKFNDMAQNPTLFIKTDIKHVHLEELPVKDLFMGYAVKGKLDLKGTCDIAGQIIKTGEINIFLKDMEVAIKNRLIGIDTLSFDSIEIEADILDNRVEVKRGDVSGKQASGVITGAIDIKVPFELSRLALIGNVKPQPDFLKNITKRLPIGGFLNKMNLKNGIPFTINGTVSDPDFSMDR